MKEHWDHLEQVFFELLEFSKQEREERLNEMEESEAKALTEMLQHHSEAGRDGFLDIDLAGTPPTSIPKTFGPYRVIKELGRGGMGSVYLAERSDDHFEQRVAIKQLHYALASQDVLARFRIERQLLAQFQHSGIAKLIDGGVDKNQMPYLVMEYIQGCDLITYCEKNECTLSERLDLFKQICEAVQYAHQNLVVHRDLKPTNILVTEEGHVKLLDFGIAKILESELDAITKTKDATPMTPRYSSPEQILGEPITTACDIYTLGILLFELLTDKRPFGEHPSIHTLHFSVLEKKPNQPSTGFSPSFQRIERHRARDLDAICLKCLQRDPGRRYQTVSNLVEDLTRFSLHQPVSAKGDSNWYRISKFLYRHKIMVGISTAFAMLLLLAILGLIMQSQEIKRESERVVRQQKRSEAVASFLENLFFEADPEIAMGPGATTKDLLKRGVERIDNLQSSQPDMHRALTQVLSTVYLHLGDYDQALKILERIKSDPNLSEMERIDFERTMGEIHLGKGNLTTAKEHLLAAETLASSDETSSKVHMSIQLTLGDLYSRFKKADLADKAYQKALSFAIQNNSGIKGDMALLKVQSQIARHEAEKSNWDRALEMHRSVLEQKEMLWPKEHPSFGVSHGNLANVLRWKRQFTESESHFLSSIENLENAYPGGHMLIATTKNNYAGMLKDMGRFEEAREYYKSSLNMLIALYGEDHPRVIMAQNNMAIFFVGIKKYPEAFTLFNMVIEKAQKILPKTHTFPYTVRSSFGVALQRAGHAKKAEEQFKQLIEDLEKVAFKSQPLREQLANCEIKFGNFLFHIQREQEAIAHYEKSIASFSKHIEGFPPKLAFPYFSYTRGLIAVGDYKKAEKFGRRNLEIHAKRDSEPLNISIGKSYLGIALLHLGQREEAKANLENVVVELEEGLGLEYRETQQAIAALGELYDLEGNMQAGNRLKNKIRPKPHKTYSHR